MLWKMFKKYNPKIDSYTLYITHILKLVQTWILKGCSHRLVRNNIDWSKWHLFLQKKARVHISHTHEEQTVVSCNMSAS